MRLADVEAVVLLSAHVAELGQSWKRYYRQPGSMDPLWGMYAVGPQLPAQRCHTCDTPLVHLRNMDGSCSVLLGRFEPLVYACNLLDDDHA